MEPFDVLFGQIHAGPADRRWRPAETGLFSFGGGHDQFEAYFGHFRVKEVFTIHVVPGQVTNRCLYRSDPLGLGLRADQLIRSVSLGGQRPHCVQASRRDLVLERSRGQFSASAKLVMACSVQRRCYPGL
jgi:hypothetical protein